MKKATFYLDDIVYDRVIIESSNLPQDDNIDIDFQSSGVFKTDENQFYLTLTFFAFGENVGMDKNYIQLTLTALFKFRNLENYDGIPPHFFDNSIAMVYPFIRAFTTSIAFQANLKRKFMLPTMNLVGLGDELKNNTVVE